MCNYEVLDAIREQVMKLVSYTGDIRNRFTEVDEEFREGNLDGSALGALNQAIHQLENNTAAFEKILEG